MRVSGLANMLESPCLFAGMAVCYKVERWGTEGEGDWITHWWSPQAEASDSHQHQRKKEKNKEEKIQETVKKTTPNGSGNLY